MSFFVPPDNDALREKWADSPQHGGTCGVSCIAALERTSVQSVIDRWAGESWPGYSPMRGMVSTLKALGYSVERRRGMKAKEFPLSQKVLEGGAAIVRIQWLDDDGKDYSGFMERARHTHYVLMQEFPESNILDGSGKTIHVDQGVYVFCNGEAGWFKAYGRYALRYLQPGYVSSYLEVSK